MKKRPVVQTRAASFLTLCTALMVCACARIPLGDPATMVDTGAPAAAANAAPTIIGLASTAAYVGVAYRFLPVAADADKDPLTFSIVHQPAWASFSSATGELSGTPTAADVGSYADIAITVSDGRTQTALAAFSLSVVLAALGTATLSWVAPTLNEDGTPLVGLSGYRIYYGTDSNALDKTVVLGDPSVIRHTITDLTPGTWFFGVAAVSANGSESRLSGLASKTIY